MAPRHDAPGSRWAVRTDSVTQIFITGPDRLVRDDRIARVVALLSGLIFIAAGLMKFVFHDFELHAFRSFDLPWPAALEILAGIVETVGGVLLVMRRGIAPTAVTLAVTMVVAIASSGIGHGDVIPSLTLAPVLLAAMIYLLARGLSSRAIQRGIRR